MLGIISLVIGGSFIVLVLYIALFEIKQRKRRRAYVLVDPSVYPKPVPSVLRASPYSPTREYATLWYNTKINKKNDIYRHQKLIVPGDPVKMVTTNFFGYIFVACWNPAAVEQVLVKDKKKWGKITSINAAFTNILGKSVLSVQGEEWKAQRKVLNPGFTAGHVKTLTPAFNEVADSLLEKLDEICAKTDAFEPYVWMSKATLDALGKAGFGEDFGVLSDKLSIVYSSYETIFQALMNPLFLKKWYTSLPTKTNADFTEAKKQFFSWAQTIIDHKLHAITADYTPESRTILDLLVNSHYDGNITREELSQNFLLFFLAGHETTSGTLTMLIYFLSRHPEVQEKCLKEIEEIFGDEDPTTETISQLKYVENVILEGARIYGPSNGLARGALEDCEVQGYFMPKGTIINILMCNLHNDPDLWENPSEFNPDRWDSEALPKNLTHSYMPFGSGTRICLGLSFAKVEMRVTLVKLIRRYEFFPKTPRLSFPRSISLRPQSGFQVGIKLRNK